jgi:hypothetical protein
LTTSTPQTPRKRRWSWVWLALLVSLALNLAVAAAVIAHNFWGPGGRHHQHRITGPGYTQVLPRAFFRQLDDDPPRGACVGELRVHRSEFRGLRAICARRHGASPLRCRAEPFDQAALEQRHELLMSRPPGHDCPRWRDCPRLFAKLTPAERRLMADEIERKSRAAQAACMSTAGRQQQRECE